MATLSLQVELNRVQKNVLRLATVKAHVKQVSNE